MADLNESPAPEVARYIGLLERRGAPEEVVREVHRLLGELERFLQGEPFEGLSDDQVDWFLATTEAPELLGDKSRRIIDSFRATLGGPGATKQASPESTSIIPSNGDRARPDLDDRETREGAPSEEPEAEGAFREKIRGLERASFEKEPPEPRTPLAPRKGKEGRDLRTGARLYIVLVFAAVAAGCVFLAPGVYIFGLKRSFHNEISAYLHGADQEKMNRLAEWVEERAAKRGLSLAPGGPRIAHKPIRYLTQTLEKPMYRLTVDLNLVKKLGPFERPLAMRVSAAVAFVPRPKKEEPDRPKEPEATPEVSPEAGEHLPPAFISATEAALRQAHSQFNNFKRIIRDDMGSAFSLFLSDTKELRGFLERLELDAQGVGDPEKTVLVLEPFRRVLRTADRIAELGEKVEEKNGLPGGEIRSEVDRLLHLAEADLRLVEIRMRELR